MQMPNLLSLLVPVAYLSILLGSLATFSYLHRRRKVTQSLSLAPYFPPHTSRNVYLTLLHQADAQSDLKQVPNSILCAALQERAVDDILRIREIQTRKGPLNTLLQRGVVGDEIWQRLLRAEQELEAELKDVVSEANALANGWGTTIFQSANEIVVNRMTKAKIEERRRGLKDEKEAWEAQKAKARLELEAEVGLNSVGAKEKVEVLEKVLETAPVENEKEKVVSMAASSDEDAVMVETPAGETVTDSTTTTANAGSGGGKNKKKKSKK